MDTVDFQCDHCRKLIRIGGNMLGTKVRCPHCRKVMTAPAQKPAQPTPVSVPAASEPASSRPPSTVEIRIVAPKDEQDSIFVEHATDDLFGSHVQKPVIEVPPGPPTGQAAVATPSPTETRKTPSVHGVPAPKPKTGTPSKKLPPATFTGKLQHFAEQIAIYLAYGFLILLGYSLLITILALYFYLQWKNAPVPNRPRSQVVTPSSLDPAVRGA